MKILKIMKNIYAKRRISNIGVLFDLPPNRVRDVVHELPKFPDVIKCGVLNVTPPFVGPRGRSNVAPFTIPNITDGCSEGNRRHPWPMPSGENNKKEEEKQIVGIRMFFPKPVV